MRFPTLAPILMFLACYSLQAQDLCKIVEMKVQTGTCTSDSTYSLTLNMDVKAPTDESFDLWGNGRFIGTYNLSQLPLKFDNFPSIGGTGYVAACINDDENCCAYKPFQAPVCAPTIPCSIFDAKASAGKCYPDGTYELAYSFSVAEPTSKSYEIWTGTGKYLGQFPLDSSSGVIERFPWSGNTVDYMLICISGNPQCCKLLEITPPACQKACDFFELGVARGDCTSDSTYKLCLKLLPTTTAPFVVDVYAGNGKLVGSYKHSDFPLCIDKFPAQRGILNHVVATVKTSDTSFCSQIRYFKLPNCIKPDCGIDSITVKTGKCNPDGSFEAWIDFKTSNPNVVKFGVGTGNGNFLGFFETGDLPIYIPSFPAGESEQTSVYICTGDILDPTSICCTEQKFQKPDCDDKPCDITEIKVETGNCNSDGSYPLSLNFKTTAPAGSKFIVYSSGGKELGVFTTDKLPVKIEKYPSNNEQTDKLRICIWLAGANEPCCTQYEFKSPVCNTPCPDNLLDIEVKPGDCHANGKTYSLSLGVKIQLPVGIPFKVFSANGQLVGEFNTNSLPVKIDSFPWNGKEKDEVKICVSFGITGASCCKTVTFLAPCAPSDSCGINDIAVETGQCNEDGTYPLALNFKTTAPAGSKFIVYTSTGKEFIFTTDKLPVKIEKYPSNGDDSDYLKICLWTPNSNEPCCDKKEFKAPVCKAPCDAYSVEVALGDCSDDGTYKLKLEVNSELDHVYTFEVFNSEGKSLGKFSSDKQPVVFEKYAWNGKEADFIKICIVSPSPAPGAEGCCKIKQFKTPCQPTPCNIDDIKVEVGQCNPNGTFPVALNFKPSSPGKFIVYTKGQSVGMFSTADLPVKIAQFPGGPANSASIKICLFTANASAPCCEEYEFKTPECDQPCPADLIGVKVETGACSEDGKTYKLWLNLDVPLPGNIPFEVFAADGKSLGKFSTKDLPLSFEKFPWNGKETDAVKICLNFGVTGALCCATKEFKAPCQPKASCEISNLKVTTSDSCNTDGTYMITLDFKTSAQKPAKFLVYTSTGKELGGFSTDQLPLKIDKYPANGKAGDVLKICVWPSNANEPCCEKVEFKTPACTQKPCSITDIKVKTGECCGDGDYPLAIDFKTDATLPAKFVVYNGEGKVAGVFGVLQLPVLIPHFPTNGSGTDKIKICLLNADSSVSCCETYEFEAPKCGLPCNLVKLKVETGDCSGEKTYRLKIDVLPAPAGIPLEIFASNGQSMGKYNTNDLPIVLDSFLWSGKDFDMVKVCLGKDSQQVCCVSETFKAPDCMSEEEDDCDKIKVEDFKAETGPCNADGTFQVTIDFKTDAGKDAQFIVYSTGKEVGTFKVSDLPLKIEKYPGTPGKADPIKICLLTAQGTPCCKTFVLKGPDCEPVKCEKIQVKASALECTSEKTARVKIDVINAPSGDAPFEVFAGTGESVGTFTAKELPLTLDEFPLSGGISESVKVCFSVNGEICCSSVKFKAPKCPAPTCGIDNIKVETGQCNADGAYPLTLNFSIPSNTPVKFMVLAGGGKPMGTYSTADLPLKLEKFPASGKATDQIKICVLDPAWFCCKEFEFPAPACPKPCVIYNLKVEAEGCKTDSTYRLYINFLTLNNAQGKFSVYTGDSVLVGNYLTTDLPLKIENFPSNGTTNGKAIICLASDQGGDCCEMREFKAPTCNKPCNADDYTLEAKVGECTSDKTYKVKFDLDDDLPKGVKWAVYINGKLFNTYGDEENDIEIEKFPWGGGETDKVKICIVSPLVSAACCKEIEVKAPACLKPGDGPCTFEGLQVMRTPCVCGQFFALLTFTNKGGGADGFSIKGNGVNYGNFKYNIKQPIVLGPLKGDNQTAYEFALQDLKDPSCKSFVELGKVSCPGLLGDDDNERASITVSPNPASEWIQVTTQFPGVGYVGQSTVEIYRPDGHRVAIESVPDGGNFNLDVSGLTSGVYRIVVSSASGRADKVFTKQQL